MKKTYQQPIIKMVNIQLCQLMAGSLGDSTTPNMNLGDAETATNIEAGARSFSVWGDEDEEY